MRITEGLLPVNVRAQEKVMRVICAVVVVSIKESKVMSSADGCMRK